MYQIIYIYINKYIYVYTYICIYIYIYCKALTQKRFGFFCKSFIHDLQIHRLMGTFMSHTCIYNGLSPPIHIHTTLAHFLYNVCMGGKSPLYTFFPQFFSQCIIYTRICIVCIFIYNTWELSRPIHVYTMLCTIVYTCIYKGLSPPIHVHTTLAFHPFCLQCIVYTHIYIVYICT